MKTMNRFNRSTRIMIAALVLVGQSVSFQPAVHAAEAITPALTPPTPTINVQVTGTVTPAEKVLNSLALKIGTGELAGTAFVVLNNDTKQQTVRICAGSKLCASGAAVFESAPLVKYWYGTYSIKNYTNILHDGTVTKTSQLQAGGLIIRMHSTKPVNGLATYRTSIETSTQLGNGESYVSELSFHKITIPGTATPGLKLLEDQRRFHLDMSFIGQKPGIRYAGFISYTYDGNGKLKTITYDGRPWFGSATRSLAVRMLTVDVETGLAIRGTLVETAWTQVSPGYTRGTTVSMINLTGMAVTFDAKGHPKTVGNYAFSQTGDQWQLMGSSLTSLKR